MHSDRDTAGALVPKLAKTHEEQVKSEVQVKVAKFVAKRGGDIPV